MANADFEQFLGDARARYPWLPFDLAKHYARLYGTRMHDLLGSAQSVSELGTRFSKLLYAREAQFLRDTEWALQPEDVLERRTKHGLHMTAEDQEIFVSWWSSQRAAA